MSKEAFYEIAEKAGASLTADHEVLINEVFQKVGISDKKNIKFTKPMAEQISLAVGRVLEDNPKLQPFAQEITKTVLDASTKDTTKAELGL